MPLLQHLQWQHLLFHINELHLQNLPLQLIRHNSLSSWKKTKEIQHDGAWKHTETQPQPSSGLTVNGRAARSLYAQLWMLNQVWAVVTIQKHKPSFTLFIIAPSHLNICDGNDGTLTLSLEELWSHWRWRRRTRAQKCLTHLVHVVPSQRTEFNPQPLSHCS